MRNTLIIIVLTIFAALPDALAQGGTLRTGDLLFVRAADSGFSAAIDVSTARPAAADSYDHVAIAVRTDSGLRVIEAAPRLGVVCRPYSAFAADNGPERIVALRPSPIDTSEVARLAQGYVGRPYDRRFLPDDRELYCSELVWLCYRRADGSPLFATEPMNFRAPDGTMPAYWVQHFRELGMPIPEGVPGTNPNMIAGQVRSEE